MIERQYKYSVQFCPCAKCGKQPIMFQSWGSAQKLISGTEGSYFHVECCRCQVKTARFKSTNDAVVAWESQNQVIAEAA